MPEPPESIALPRVLTKGSKLAVFSPSFPIGAQYPRRLARGVAELEKCGFRVQIDSTCETPGGLTALPPEELAEAFHALLEDPEVDGIIAAVGGWSMNAVLPYINYRLVRAARKVIVGYSDVSALLLAILARSRLVTFHGPAVLSEWGEASGVWSYTRDYFLEQVCGGRTPMRLAPPPETTDEFLAWEIDDVRRRTASPATPWRGIRCGSASGPLVGGCMSTLALQLGTEYMPSVDGALLFLEEENTTPDRHLAYLESLRQHGVFRRIAGLVIGRLSRPRPMLNGFDDFDEAVRIALRDTNFPIAVDLDIGHTEPMVTLPMGGLARMNCSSSSVGLELLERAGAR